jgi:hypothetical protein
MQFRVDFTGPVREPVAGAASGAEPFYQRAVLNPRTSIPWRGRVRIPKERQAKPTLAAVLYEIPVQAEGIYRVDGNFLKAHGIDLSSLDASTLKVFNNGGHMLPVKLTDPRPDGLIENPILVVGAEDGRFDETDYFLFYGKGAGEWQYVTRERRYRHFLHLYARENVYWLSFNDGVPGKRMAQVQAPTDGGVPVIETFKDLQYIEQDVDNPLHGGLFWYAYAFEERSPEVTLDVHLADVEVNDTVTVWMQFKGDDKVDASHAFRVSWNDQSVGSTQFGGVDFKPYQVTLRDGVPGSENTLAFHYTTSARAGKAYLDWVEIQYRRRIAARDGMLRFYSPSGAGSNGYRLTGFASEPLVLDVTDPGAVHSLALTPEGEAYRTGDVRTDAMPHVYIAVEPARFLAPASMQKDDPSDLRNPENAGMLLIVTHGDFMEQARRYADFKRSSDSLSVYVADVQDVYDEFNCGLMDPAALRDFLATAFRTWREPPQYLLLFGDGDYDYRNIVSDGDRNWIPPFERDEFKTDDARATDDWYTYVSGTDTEMDLSVGRLPVQTAEQARVVVDKLIRYQSEPVYGDWRSLITLVGDDEIAALSLNETEHILYSEDLAEGDIPRVFNLRKIYLTEYPEEIRMMRVKPKAQDDLIDQINRGTLIVNYLGHGHRDLWAHERVFDHGPDLPRLENGDLLPLFYAATCEFGLYDDPFQQHFAEELLASPGKGAIAVIAATRFCISFQNAALNQAFMNYCLWDPHAVLRLGDALRLGKLSTSFVSNNEQYHVLGDPSMRLGIPRHEVSFTQMDPDTFRALGRVRVQGEVHKDGTLWGAFNGRALVRAFDSEKAIVYTTKRGSKLPYTLAGNALFRGEAAVEGGRFELEFIVPKDLSYGGSLGRLSGYCWNEGFDGFGSLDSVATGGSVALEDDQGPEIQLSFTGQGIFLSGGVVSGDPELVVGLEDEKSGINLTGEIGHRITVSLDGQVPADVTDRFQYDSGSYLKGSVKTQLDGLAEGDHRLLVKAWDNANNSSSASLEFRSVASDRLVLDKVLNVPNPMLDGTDFTFELSQGADVRIKIFTVDGRLIRTLNGFWAQPGFNVMGWDGLDFEGDAVSNGVYLYKVIARAGAGSKTIEASAVGKLIVMR